MAILITPECFNCGKTGTVEVTEAERDAHLAGGMVQDVFPNYPIPVREQISSGMHPACWEEMFG